MSKSNTQQAQAVAHFEQIIDPWYWAYSTPIQLVGGRFDLNGREFQVRPMSVNSRIKVIRKATQTTFTESEVLSCLCRLINGLYPRGVLYLFPSKEEVTDFSSSRFNPLINDNPETIGAYVRETNRANLRRIGSGFLYFRSGRLHSEIQGQAKSSSHLKSIPVDHAVHDEYDEMHARIDEFVEGRLSASDVGTKSYLANPTLPDYGISSKFDQSSQEYWHVRCRACNTWTCLDDTDDRDPFPYFHELSDGKVIRACPKCGKELDVRFGEWVAKKPGITESLGFTIGHPSIHWIDPGQLMTDWRTTQDRANFIRLRLGRPFVEAENRLSIQDVMACCGDHGIAESYPTHCTMGVDQGKDLHVVIGTRHGNNIVHLGIYQDFEHLDKLIKAFNVQRCVIDALPETRKAREFATRNPGVVYLNYYNENQKGSYAWKEDQAIVQCNRTESLDASHREVIDRVITIPRESDLVRTFADHLHNVAKKLEEDEETGSRRYVYVKLGPDHFRHAFNYECMARQSAPALWFPKGIMRMKT